MTRFFSALGFAWAAFWEYYVQSAQVDQIADAVAQQSIPEPRGFQTFELDLEEVMACGSDQDRAAAAKVQEHIELVNADPTIAIPTICTHDKTVLKMSDGSEVVITRTQDDNIPEIRHPYYLDESGDMKKPGS